MLVALIYLNFQSGTFAIVASQPGLPSFHNLKLGMTEQRLIFIAFLLAFAVKVPMWPVHTWLPDAHVETGAVLGIAGGMVQMISHGFISGALFLCVGVLYDRLHSRDIAAYGGVVNTMPVFGALMVFFALANSGLPGTSGFVGEFLVIRASFRADFLFAFLAATTLILGAAYTLWMVKRVIFGPVTNAGVAGLKDANGRELFVLGSLAVAVLALGLWPAPLVEVMDSSIQNLVQHIAVSKIAAASIAVAQF